MDAVRRKHQTFEREYTALPKKLSDEDRAIESICGMWMYGRSDPAISYDMLVCETAEKYTGGKYQYGQEEDGDSKWVLVDGNIGLTSRDNVKEIRERHKDDVYFLIAVVDRIGERIDLPDGTETGHTLFQFHQKGEAGPQTPTKR